MAQERIDIVIKEHGSRTVQRNIRDIGRESRTAGQGVHYLKRALAGIGLVVVARELTSLLDIYVNLQNRIRATGSAGEELTSVFNELLGVANETRQSLEGTATIYARLAVSSKELGVTTRELIDFTRSLNQAVSLSGATSKEALAALIQLSQGMAAGQLRGDELRSVLEQLPAVADVIAVKLGVARGALREVAEQGRITADVILEAFRDAREELSERFAQSIPTLGQAFNVLKNQVIAVLGVFNEEVGITATLTKAIMGLALSLDGVTDALILITRVGTVAAVTFGALYAAQKVATLRSAIASWVEYRKAIAGGTAVALGSAEAERQKLAATVAGIKTTAQATITELGKARATEASTMADLASARATQAKLAAERQMEVLRLSLMRTEQGRIRSIRRLAELRRAELAMSKSVTAAEALQAQAHAATTVAESKHAVASHRLRKAKDQLAAASKRAAGSTTLLGQAVTAVTGKMAALNAVIAANPIIFLTTVIVGATAALFIFRDQIKLGTDDLTTLGDLMRAFGEQAGPAFDKLKTAASDALSVIGDAFDSLFGDIEFSLVGALRLYAKFIDSYVGVWIGAYQAIKTTFDRLPGALGDSAIRAFNIVLGKINEFINNALDKLNPLLEFLGQDTISTEVDIKIKNPFEGQANNLGADIGNAFKEGFESSNFASEFLEDSIKRAQEIAKERTSEKKAPFTQPTSGGDGGELAKLTKNLDQLLGRYNSVYAAQLQYVEAEELLTQAVDSNLISQQKKHQLLDLIYQQLEDQLDPMGALNQELTEQQELLRLTNREREVETQLRSIQQDLLSSGIVLNEAELAQLRERLSLIQQETAAAEARNRVYEQITGPQKEFTDQLTAINDLLASGQISREQANKYIVESQGALMEGTIEHQQAMLTAYQEQYARIDELREADLVSEQSAAQMKKKLDVDLMEQRLKGARQFYGNLSALSKSENRAIAAIGKGAAITQATIDGVLAVQKALASAPPPANYAIAASVGAATAANIAQIMAQTPGYAFGGEFTVGGQGGTDSQMVAFRATPGEKVAISTPQQERDRKRTGTDDGPATTDGGYTIVNLLDPALMEDYLNTAAGERLFVNMIRRNSDALKGVLG